MIAKLILALTMAASAILGGGGAQLEGYYLRMDDAGQPTLWEETNGHADLQTEWTVVVVGPIRFEYPPDTRILL